MRKFHYFLFAAAMLMLSVSAQGQIGRRFPSERKVIKDPVTGVELVFLTSQQGVGNAKPYQTHNQWTCDGKWVIFTSSQRVQGEALLVNEETGDIVQVTEGGYNGMLNLSRKEMKLYISRPHYDKETRKQLDKYNKEVAALRKQMQASGQQAGQRQQLQTKTPRPVVGNEFVAIDLAAVLADSEAGKMKKMSEYETVLGVTPVEWGGGTLAALDGDEKIAFFSVGREYAASQAGDMVMEKTFGPRNMGAGPSGLAYMDLTNGECHYIRTIPFQVGHIQGNPWHAKEVVFCWETGGKAPTRVWAMNADGSNYRPVYKEASHDWVTHEAVITEDEIVIAVLGHRPISETQEASDNTGDPTNPGQELSWGYSGTREYATGIATVNLRTREFILEGQIPFGSGFWHVAGSVDGNWVAGDDFARNIYLVDRHTHELIHLSAGHKETASDHPHPTFKPDGTAIEIQSAMLQEDGRSRDICIIKMPQYLLDRYKK
ncbi:MAG: hypothetical protein IJS25_06490 [Bacteroidales bacterium]|nr:hypothetical protein [Bacteroidales bacterium]